MDGWMSGWVDGWVGGWVGGRCVDAVHTPSLASQRDREVGGVTQVWRRGFHPVTRLVVGAPQASKHQRSVPAVPKAHCFAPSIHVGSNIRCVTVIDSGSPPVREYGWVPDLNLQTSPVAEY